MQKKKSGVKKCLEICAIKGGGVGPLMANAILNFHFDFLTPSLIIKIVLNKKSIVSEPYINAHMPLQPQRQGGIGGMACLGRGWTLTC